MKIDNVISFTSYPISKQEIKYILDLAVENGLYREIKTKDGRSLKGMTVLKGLQADGMSFKKMIDINNRLIEAGYSPADCLSYGVGGNLHDLISRSNMSAAQKKYRQAG